MSNRSALEALRESLERGEIPPMSVTRASREVNLSLSLGLHVAIESVTSANIKDPSEAAMNGVLWCILKQTDPNPMGVIQKVLIEPNSHEKTGWLH